MICVSSSTETNDKIYEIRAGLTKNMQTHSYVSFRVAAEVCPLLYK